MSDELRPVRADPLAKECDVPRIPPQGSVLCPKPDKVLLPIVGHCPHCGAGVHGKTLHTVGEPVQEAVYTCHCWRKVNPERKDA
jgi:hypothetical protein